MNILNRTLQRVNSLSFRIMAIFWGIWLLILILMAILFRLPQFDTRNYSPLNQQQIFQYQKDISLAIHNGSIQALQSGKNDIANKLPGTTTFPILYSPEDKSLLVGDINNPKKLISAINEFIPNFNNPLKPYKKQFYECIVAGPFLMPTLTNQDNKPYLIFMVTPTNAQRNFVEYLFDHYFLIVILLFIIFTPIIYLLISRITRPIRELGVAANSIASGNFKANEELEKNNITEIYRVGRSFNQMANSLQEMRVSQERLLSDISHEMRTPLTRLQLSASLLRRQNGDNVLLERIDRETARIESMLGSLLTLSRKQLSTHAERRIFNINQIWKTVIQDATFESNNRAHHINFSFESKIDKPDRFYINGDQKSLESALENLVRNAIKYANSKVTVCTKIEHKKLIINVDDDGPGVPEDQFELIFRPFYRIDDARARKTGGFGLGLTIVSNAIQRHQGEVTASKSPLGGLRITIKLPLWFN